MIERDVLAPAFSVLNDPRFSGGVRSEFDQARKELKLGTPESLKQSLHEAACSVESAMKVVLDERGISRDQRGGHEGLFNRLRDAGLVGAETESLLLACATPRNRRGGHGAGAVAHDVQQHEAEAYVAAAATAISFLGKLLPFAPTANSGELGDSPAPAG